MASSEPVGPIGPGGPGKEPGTSDGQGRFQSAMPWAHLAAVVVGVVMAFAFVLPTGRDIALTLTALALYLQFAIMMLRYYPISSPFNTGRLVVGLVGALAAIFGALLAVPDFSGALHVAGLILLAIVPAALVIGSVLDAIAPRRDDGASVLITDPEVLRLPNWDLRRIVAIGARFLVRGTLFFLSAVAEGRRRRRGSASS